MSFSTSLVHLVLVLDLGELVGGRAQVLDRAGVVADRYAPVTAEAQQAGAARLLFQCSVSSATASACLFR